MRRIEMAVSATLLAALGLGVAAAVPANASTVNPVGEVADLSAAAPSDRPYGASLVDEVAQHGGPAFRFEYEFSIGDVTPSEAMRLVRDCFACVLPLGGAPDGFPAEGEVVPFTIPVITAADDFTSTVTTWDAIIPITPGFQLTAADGNLTGDGSVVAFSFFRRGGENLLSVDGLVTNDLGEHTADYTRVTSGLWAEFAARVAASASARVAATPSAEGVGATPNSRSNADESKTYGAWYW